MSDAASINGLRDRRWLILGVIGLAQLMVVLDLTVIPASSARPGCRGGRSARCATWPGG